MADLQYLSLIDCTIGANGVDVKIEDNCEDKGCHHNHRVFCSIGV